MRDFIRSSWYKSKLAWPLLAVLLGLAYIKAGGSELLRQQLGVLAWKAVLVGAAVTLAHIVRKQLFPYVDVSAHLEEKSVAGAVVFLATALVYAAIILAVCSGL